MPCTKRPILCVDDNEEACLMLTRLLENEGYEVRSAQSIQEALGLAHRESFGLYTLDSWLAEGSGVELCKEIREFDSHTPIIFYSAAAFDSDIEAALKAGASEYVTKPEIERLIEVVERLLLDV
jgi:CheY-like chemotaxis protein